MSEKIKTIKEKDLNNLPDLKPKYNLEKILEAKQGYLNQNPILLKGQEVRDNPNPQSQNNPFSKAKFTQKQRNCRTNFPSNIDQGLQKATIDTKTMLKDKIPHIGNLNPSSYQRNKEPTKIRE